MATSATARPTPPVIVWFRQDLRLADNPALAKAAALGRPVLPLYILDEASAGCWAPGGASRWWLHHSLAALADALRRRGLPLILRRGPAAEVLDAVLAESGADSLLWNRGYEPWRRACDSAIKQRLRARGLTVESFNASLLFEPWTVETGGGGPYRVFTPFWKAVAARPVEPPLPAPETLTPAPAIASDTLDSWQLLPHRPDWAGGLRERWRCGEEAAVERLRDFLDGPLRDYAAARDRPAASATSRLSPHLHWGEIGPRQVWHAVQHALARGAVTAEPAQRFLAELGWREFSAHLLYHWPELPERAWRPAFRAFPWRDDPAGLAAWQRGRTGYPLVDAGMRELWATGWMHNRVRMVAASFLVKHLLIPWQAGAAWFWDTLVDADLASNAASWQWVAGSGADAAPYFRIFNPVSQGEKFDPAGAYVRRWVPELAGLPDALIHKPWTASPEPLRAAGVVLGENYPAPLVDHAAARSRALAAFATLRQAEP